MFDYDFAILAIPIAFLTMDGYVRGWLPYERGILVLTWVMPLIAVGLADYVGIQIAPACIAALFVVATRRALLNGTAPESYRASGYAV
jgi:hypothetical protein